MQKYPNLLKMLNKKSKYVELLVLHVKTSKQTSYDMRMSHKLVLDDIKLLSIDVHCGKKDLHF